MTSFIIILLISAWSGVISYHPVLDTRRFITKSEAPDTEVAANDPYFPAFHPRLHAAHNNDVNGPFYFKGIYHLFMQQDLPWAPKWNGAIGWGHLVSTDLAHWKEISSFTGFDDPLVPGRWSDPQYGIPGGGYYSGSATIVNGIPRLVFPAYFTIGDCIEPWQPGGKDNKCHMEIQMSEPANLSDPYLAEWKQPVTILRHTDGMSNHSFVDEDPAGAWPDPTSPGAWVFITQTSTWPKTPGGPDDVLLQAWSSKGGSNWSQGWNYLGDFFPGTGDSRCPGPTCGFFTPSFASGHAFNGYHFLYVGNNQYWLGHYDYPKFVPVTNPLGFDGPDSSCFKGFYDEYSDRYLIWSWVASGQDPLVNRGWDSMLSVTREVTVDEQLLQIKQYPVEEIANLRGKILASASGLVLQEGLTPIAGASGSQLDIEVSFDWGLSGGSIAAGTIVGVSVLAGTEERTLISLQCGGTTANSTGGLAAATMVKVDTTLSRARNSTPTLPAGDISVVPMVMKPLEAVLVLRVLVDRSVIEAFVQRGRVTTTRRVYPSRTDSLGVGLFFKAPHAGAQSSSPTVRVTVWEMGSAFHTKTSGSDTLIV